MGYVIETIPYGTRPWQYLELAVPDTGGPYSTIVCVAGGGWGLRDSAPLLDPTHPGRELPVRLFMTPGEPNFERYAIAAVNVASNSHNNLASSLDFPTAWALGANFTQDQEVNYNGFFYRCRGTHFSESGTEPDSATAPTSGNLPAGLILWQRLYNNDMGTTRIPWRGEMTAGFGGQSPIDIRLANGHLRKNAEQLNLNGLLSSWGGSAGAYDIQRAAADGNLPATLGDTPEAVHVAKPVSRTDFDCVASYWTPSRADLWATIPVNQNAQLTLSFMTSLYGRPGLNNVTAWNEFPDDVKKSIDPYWITLGKRLSAPTYLISPDSSWDDRPAADVLNGNLAASYKQDLHHALFSKYLMEVLTGPEGPSESGGLGRTDCVHVDVGSSGTEWRRHTAYPSGGNGTPGTDFTLLNGDYLSAVGTDIAAWWAQYLG